MFATKKITYLIAMLLLSISTLSSNSVYAVGEGRQSKYGFVQARGVVLGPNEQPILVEITDSGEEIEIGELFGELEGAFVMPGMSYRTAVLMYELEVEAKRDGIARGAVIFSLEEYNNQRTNLGTVLVPVLTPDQLPQNKIIQGPLIENTNIFSVVVRSADTILDPELLGEDGPILLKSPIDLRDRQTLGEEIKAVLLTKDGKVHSTYENNISYKSAFFQPDDEGRRPSPRPITDDVADRVLNPIRGTRITQSYMSGNAGVYSDDKGRYRIDYYIPPCPCFSFDYPGYVFAEVPYKNFNPKSQERFPFGTYMLKYPTYDYCSGLGQCPLFAAGGLTGLLTQASIIGIESSISIAPVFRSDLRVDAVMLAGEGILSNTESEDEKIPVANDTQYNLDKSSFFEQVQQGFGADLLNWDFDADRKPDEAIYDANSGYYYIYLGGRTVEYDNNGVPINEDLRRRPDQLPDYKNRGLLESITLEDLEQTDLYVFRVASGQLVLERQGLKQSEFVRFNSAGADADEANFYYKFLIPGPLSFSVAAGFNRISDAQSYFSRAGIKLDVYEGNHADYLRTGEQVQIIAINRPTGYIGSVVVPLQLNNREGRTTIDVPIDKLILQPPNIKIKAERTTKTQLGLTQGEINEYLIGSEGSGLTSDEYISISTEWYDQDGLPLPENLPGYSATLAKVVSSNQLAQDQACASQINSIDIKPGAQLQLLKLKERCDLNKEHYYVYVCGHNQAGNNRDQCYDFSEEGRPGYYTPIKVPIFDEIATRQQENIYRYAEQDDLDPEKPEPIYRWVYRPEMQFSVFDLQQQQIRLEYEREGIVQTVNLADASPQTIAEIFDRETDYVDIFYSLLGNENEVVDSFAPERELIFSLGDHELELRVTDNGRIRFDNLDGFITMNPEDFLALQIYQNSDAGNMLWEYAINARVIMHSLAEVDRQEAPDSNTASNPYAIDPNVSLGNTLKENVKQIASSIVSTAQAQGGVILDSKVSVSSGRVYYGRLPNEHFYPALGHKKIFITGSYPRLLFDKPYGSDDKVWFRGAFIGTRAVHCNLDPAPDFEGPPAIPGEAGDDCIKVKNFDSGAASDKASFTDGFAKFLILSKTVDGNIYPQPKIRIQRDANNNVQRIDEPIRLVFAVRTAEDKITTLIPIQPRITIKNNSNTSVEDVLKGEGIFVYSTGDDNDNVNQENYRQEGRSYGRVIVPPPQQRTVLLIQDQQFDYVQYMLNMITIPLRIPVQESSLEYLIDVDGGYDDPSMNLVEALMTGSAASIPDSVDLAIEEEVISHDEIGPYPLIVHPQTRPIFPMYTFEKLLQDYQEAGDTTTDNIKDERPLSWIQNLLFTGPPHMDADHWRYRIITPETMRGNDRNVINNLAPATGELFGEGDPIVQNGAFIKPKSLGFFHLFRHYDWDGDGLSNLAEVENATQFRSTQQGVVSEVAAHSVFNPLDVNDPGNRLKTTYNRGNAQVSGNHNNPNPSDTTAGLGELSSADGQASPGLRVPTIGIGLYDFPQGDQVNLDSHTSFDILNTLEAAGRRWVQFYPDTYPLENNPKIHYVTGGLDPTGNPIVNPGNLRFGVNDISAPAGGVNLVGATCQAWPTRAGRDGANLPHICTLNHYSHQNGTDMDMRYVSQNELERGLTSLAIGQEGLRRTTQLINLMILLGRDVDKVIMGNDLNAAAQAYIRGRLPSVVDISFNLGHRNHAHIRFAKDMNSRPDPASFQIVNVAAVGGGNAVQAGNNVTLEYDAANAANSTYDIEIEVNDRLGNPILPWTRLRFFEDVGAAVIDVEGVNINSLGNLVSRNTLWINIANANANLHGHATLRIECLAGNPNSDAVLRLTDFQGRYNDAAGVQQDMPVTDIGVINIACRAP